MRRNTSTIVCFNRIVVIDDHNNNNDNISTINSAGLVTIIKNRPKSQLWIPYFLIGIGCVLFLVVHFWCYHKRNRERFLRKCEERRLKCGLMERRRIATLMMSRNRADIVENGTTAELDCLLIDGSCFALDNVCFTKQPEQETSHHHHYNDGDIEAIPDTAPPPPPPPPSIPQSLSMPEGIVASWDDVTTESFGDSNPTNGFSLPPLAQQPANTQSPSRQPYHYLSKGDTQTQSSSGDGHHELYSGSCIPQGDDTNNTPLVVTHHVMPPLQRNGPSSRTRTCSVPDVTKICRENKPHYVIRQFPRAIADRARLPQDVAYYRGTGDDETPTTHSENLCTNTPCVPNQSFLDISPDETSLHLTINDV